MVYFIEGEQTKLIKIGVAVDVLQRLQTLQGGSPDKLRVLKVIEDESADANYHSLFSADWSHREWFRPSKSLVKFIEGLPPGRFDGAQAIVVRPYALDVIPSQSMVVSPKDLSPVIQRALHAFNNPVSQVEN